MKTRIGKTRIELVRGDITLQDVDAVVNAANSSLMGGGGVDGAIHRAGGPAVLEECEKIVAEIGKLPAGEAVMTVAGNMKARFVIHTVGPVWSGGDHSEPEKLASCYTNSLSLASAKGLRSAAFPSISTGAYCYPVNEAAPAALGAVKEFLEERETSLDLVRFVLFSENDFDTYRGVLERIS